MARPRKISFTLREKLAKIRAAGIKEKRKTPLEDELPDLNERIKAILQIVKTEPIKATEMTYLVMYDISDNKVRTQIAKYLIKQGCVRIQQSVYLVKSKNKQFTEIHDTLKEVNEFYENADSIIMVPINASDVRSMKLIGKNVQI